MKTVLISALLIILSAAPLIVLPTYITPVNATPARPGHHPTLVVSGSATNSHYFLFKNPLKVTPALVKPSTVHIPSYTTSAHALPMHPRPSSLSSPAGVKPATFFVASPTVNCPSAQCNTVTSNAGGATTYPIALNAVDSGGLYSPPTGPGDIEPPDQTLCAGNGYVMEVLNLGELAIWNTVPAFSGRTADVALDQLMGLTGIGFSSAGDISCYYDPPNPTANNGGHWFITEIVSATPEDIGGTFAGCFAGVNDTCYEGIAVSVTNNPTGAYNVYFWNPNYPGNPDTGEGYLLNDYAKIATTRDAFEMFYDEFNLNSTLYPACPAFDCASFNGAVEVAINKDAMENGFPTTSPYFNFAVEKMGTDPALYNNVLLYPGDTNSSQVGSATNNCFTGELAGVLCWFQVIPAQASDPSQFDNSYGGSGFMLGSADFLGFYDFIGGGDNRVAVFFWDGLSALNSYNCGLCASIGFGTNAPTASNIAATTATAYVDEGLDSLPGPGPSDGFGGGLAPYGPTQHWNECFAYIGGACSLAPQRPGPTPLGHFAASSGNLTLVFEGRPTPGYVNDSIDCPTPSSLGTCHFGTFASTNVFATNLKASGTGTLDNITVNLEHAGTGKIQVALYAGTAAGPPTGKPLAISSQVTAALGENNITMPYVSIYQNDTYWIELQLSTSTPNSNPCTGSNACVYSLPTTGGQHTFTHAQSTFGAFSQYTSGWTTNATTFNATMTYFPEGGIATNGDGFTQVSQGQGALWGAVSTLITQHYAAPLNNEIHLGEAFWIFSTACYDTNGAGSCSGKLFTLPASGGQGYATAEHEDMEFASIAASPTSGALMAFTLSGNGGQYLPTTFLPADTPSCSTAPTSLGQCGYYPSTAYGMLSSKTASSLSGMNIADLGQAPADGFSEYQFYGTSSFRPRWGDYSWGIYLNNGPGSGHYYFASEYIQSAACSDSTFFNDPSCGMTRDPFANWGSSINYK